MRRSVTVISLVLFGFMFMASFSPSHAQTIKVGFNIELTGDIPKVGESSKFAAEMLKESVNSAGGIKVGDKAYKLDFVYEDNEAKAESATSSALKLITQDQVLAIVWNVGLDGQGSVDVGACGGGLWHSRCVDGHQQLSASRDGLAIGVGRVAGRA